MRAIVLVTLCALIAVALARPACNPELVEKINSGNHGWKASCNPYLHGKTLEDVKARLMPLKLTHPRERSIPSLALGAPAAIPATFDARQQWPTCIHPIRDQQQCGSCWAFAASEVISDRFCIATNGSTNVVMSPQDLVSCDTTDMGCNGGQLDHVWNWIEKHGIAADSCMPYVSGDGNVPQCPSTCKNGSPIKRYRSKDAYHVGSSILFWRRVEDIQNEIMTSGPVETGFDVYEDFMHYTSGVYKHTSGQLLGGHAVKIIGWGNENGQDYWLVANSWNTNWGEDGYFKIVRGSNNCNFESDVYAGHPAV